MKSGPDIHAACNHEQTLTDTNGSSLSRLKVTFLVIAGGSNAGGKCDRRLSYSI